MSVVSSDERINMLLTNISGHRRAIARELEEGANPERAARLCREMAAFAEYAEDLVRGKFRLEPREDA